MYGWRGMWGIWILAAVLSALTALPLQGGEPASELASASDKADTELPTDALSTSRIAPDTEHATRPAARPGQDDAGITLVIVGDTGLNGSLQPVRPDAGLRHGTPHTWASVTGGIAAEINGDLNFANLETVVTDRNDLTAPDKAFNFRSHPTGVRHLMEIGFNLISTANNHSIDFGEHGIRETLRHMEALEGAGLKAHAGIGIDREAAVRPRAVAVKGANVLFSAIGIGAGSYRAAEGRPGQLLYAAPEDFAATVARLAQAEGAYRILSVHYGDELQVMPAASDVRKLRDEAVRAGGVDLVVGHHAHVAAGVQEIEGRLVFYGLGNFLHLGMQDMAGFGLCRDYGLLARVHLARGDDGRYRARAIEAVPLTGMHARTQRMPAQQAATRIHVLNHLASRLDDREAKARGVRFTPRPDGTGLYCAPGAADEGGRIRALCSDWREPAAAPDALARQIAASCGTSYVSAARRMRAAESGKAKSTSPFAGIFGF
jgi:poly-gamma-glutamate synthesis protein (capsule biosynthesis protein)